MFPLFEITSRHWLMASVNDLTYNLSFSYRTKSQLKRIIILYNTVFLERTAAVIYYWWLPSWLMIRNQSRQIIFFCLCPRNYELSTCLFPCTMNPIKNPVYFLMSIVILIRCLLIKQEFNYTKTTRLWKNELFITFPHSH